MKSREQSCMITLLRWTSLCQLTSFYVFKATNSQNKKQRKQRKTKTKNKKTKNRKNKKSAMVEAAVAVATAVGRAVCPSESRHHHCRESAALGAGVQ